MGDCFLTLVCEVRHMTRQEAVETWDGLFDPLMAATLEIVLNSRIEELRKGLTSLGTSLSPSQRAALERYADNVCAVAKGAAAKYIEATHMASRNVASEMLKKAQNRGIRE